MDSNIELELARWIRRIETYRDSLGGEPPEKEESQPVEEQPLAELVSEPAPIRWEPEVVSLDAPEASPIQADSAQADATPLDSTGLSPAESVSQEESLPELIETSFANVHIPIDMVLSRLPKAKSFLMGIGMIGQASRTMRSELATQVAQRMSSKSERQTLLIRVSTEPGIQSAKHSKGFVEECWEPVGKSATEMRVWNAQLASLPRLRQEFGLILVDLGQADSTTAIRIGRLCDGVVLALNEPANFQPISRAIKTLQRDGVVLLGAWSIESAPVAKVA